jgi:hypothetical protein
MAEAPITEKQLVDYEPRTASGAALKERLEAAAQQESQPATPARRVVLR